MRESLEFNRIFRLYYEQLYYFALRYVNDEEDCHDIVSAVFEEVWRNFGSINDKTVKAFLYTSVRNRCIDHLRKSKLHSQYVEYATLMSQEYATDRTSLDDDDRQHLLDKVLNRLHSPTREILEACYLQEKKYREVAEEMNISISTVKKHMVRALKLLNEIKKTLKA